MTSTYPLAASLISLKADMDTPLRLNGYPSRRYRTKLSFRNNLTSRRPEPRCAAHPARISMHRAHNGRVDAIGKGMFAHKARQPCIELREIRKTSAKYNDVWVKHINDA